MLERVAHRNGTVVYRSPALAALHVPHAFTTRIGPARRELDLGRLDDEADATLRELAGFDAEWPLVSLRQVHGASVHEVLAELPTPDCEGDALVTSRADRALLVYTADCVPVLVATADGRRVAAIHAGWRGLIAGVIPAAVAVLGEAPLVAAIGPCLSLERCEMGPEVAELFERAELGAAVHARGSARPHVDLKHAARIQLERAGCRSIDVSDRCTYAHADELPSHRREVTHGGAKRASRIGALAAARR
ncbi:MAG: laccase domain-containing protein [Planctomycetes bacterium]|nr:laccase domain-containing protein [Planctomycetota bacterium]